ncbi:MULTISPECIES: IucA/IucC family siderophore biosynthesis protein [Paenarthrobacter]|uniref:IucA/IucC family protein n=1 Tax=Paenarthrobacter TaxID=1742992 RepID=UPI00084E8108|nr:MULTISPECIES: IucA/IucC family siderophore biosynthesis protein [Paenarthrobacter]NKR12596.1 IucA/IucC family protein [Arthrobacter sp. M5]NKR15912.1 IucA/IucC family protein [Arthrobacter sp. M6]OEH59888.1 IucA/IucC family protein [Arthrobacter sp. D4]OEH59966.1 IucA/IucC family protein [Arthrobacter sp. D2]QMU80949.1 IucA/IucC family siderophore biosynthesis protein [Paenarthrobacter ureafaciens]
MTSTAEAATAQSPVAHLTPERWAVANRHLVRKALAEFSHERILVPELIREEADGIGLYKVVSDDGSVEYRFRARVLELEHWSVLPDSIGRHGDGGKLPLDALDFIAEFHQTLGIGMDMLPVYLEEISSTLAGHAYKQGKPFGSVELAAGVTGGSDVAADFQAIEHSMAEGHPCFVANNGRLGFGIEDYHAFAPEAGATVQLQWIAVHRSKAVFTSSAGLDYKAHFEAELGPATVAWFNAGLSASGLDPEDYFFMPVHPWQWDNKLTVTFAAEIAQQHIVHLGHGEDSYQAQQSIRTFFNATSPGKAYVKTAMSVLNMGFMRGLSPQYMKATPAINDWLQELITKDQELQDRGLAMIKESAAIGYRNDYFEAASAKDSPYRKMLSALWRESPLPLLKDGQQLATMASLLHVDASGASMVSSLIARSGLEPTQWLRRYFDAYLVPLVHCLYNYELAFMPHGENVILILEDGVPVRAIMKDIAEEIVVMGDRLELPGEVSRIKAEIPAEQMVLAIFTDVFDCIFRFLSAILVEDGTMREDEFWGTAALVLREYQARHPELADQFDRHDLFAPDFELSCLNRLQLRNNQHMLDISDPSGGLQMAGRLANPLAKFA